MFLPQTGGVQVKWTSQIEPGRQDYMELYVYSICLGVGVCFHTGQRCLWPHAAGGGGHDIGHIDGGHVDRCSGGHRRSRTAKQGDMPGDVAVQSHGDCLFCGRVRGPGHHLSRDTRPPGQPLAQRAAGGRSARSLIAAALVWVLRKLFPRHAKFQRIKADRRFGRASSAKSSRPSRKKASAKSPTSRRARAIPPRRANRPARRCPNGPPPPSRLCKGVAGSQFYAGQVRLTIHRKSEQSHEPDLNAGPSR